MIRHTKPLLIFLMMISANTNAQVDEIEGISSNETRSRNFRIKWYAEPKVRYKMVVQESGASPPKVPPKEGNVPPREGKDVKSSYLVSITSKNEPLKPNTAYDVHLFASNINDNTDFKMMTFPVTTAPSAPSDVKIVSSLNNSLVVEWKHNVVGQTIRYNVTYQRVGDSNNQIYQTVKKENSLTIDGLASNTKYKIVNIIALTAKEEVYSDESASAVGQTAISKPGKPIIKDSTSTSLNIVWKTSGGVATPITGYNISWSPSDNEGYTFVPGAATNTTVLVDLVSNTYYNLTVTVKTSEGGLGPSSTTAHGTTVPGVPTNVVSSKPTGPSADPTTAIKVAWNKPDGGNAIINYIVEWQLSSGGKITQSLPIAHQSDVITHNKTIKPLTPGELYKIQVRAINKVRTGNLSNPITYRTDPNPPSSLQPVSSTSNNVTISWIPPSNIFEAYRVFFSNSTSKFVLVPAGQLISVSTTSYQITGLEPNSRYRFAMSSLSGSGGDQKESQLSAGIEGITFPGVPNNVVVQLGSDRKTMAKVTFDMPKNAANEYHVTLNATGETSKKNSSHTSPILLTKLTPGQTYTVSVLSVGDAGEGKATTPQTLVTEPLVVSGLSVKNYNDNSVNISWSLPVTSSYPVFVDSQIIKYYQNGNVTGAGNVSVSKTATSYDITDLKSGENYTIQVFSVNKNMLSEPTTIHKVTDILPPTYLKLIDQRTNSLQVEWPASSNAVLFYNYLVEYSKHNEDPATNKKSLKTKRNETTVTIADLIPGTSYDVSVKLVGLLESKSITETFTTSPESLKKLSIVQNPENPSTQLDLHWKSPQGAGDNITIKYSGSPEGSSKITTVDFMNTGTSLKVKPGNEYTIQATVNSVHDTSAIATIRMSSKPPQIAFTATPSAQDIKLSWKIPEGYMKNIVIDSQPSGRFKAITLDGKEISHIITGLDPSIEYTIQMYSTIINVDGKIEKSKIISKKSMTLSRPLGKPGTPVITSTSSSTIDLRWTAPDSEMESPLITGYRVFWNSSHDNGQKDVAKSVPLAVKIIDLASNTMYNVTVAAKIAKRLGPISNFTLATTAIEMPGDLKVVNSTFSTIGISWTSIKDGGAVNVTGYNVTWSPAINNGSMLVIGVNSSFTEITGLIANSRYAVKIAGKSTNKDGEFSLPINATTSVAKPASVFITNSTSTSISIMWSDVNGKALPLSGYKVSWFPKDSKVPGNNSKTTKNFTKISDLVSNTNYRIAVAVKTNNGYGPSSDILSASTKPGSPTALRLSKPAGDSGDPSTEIVVEWSKPEGGDDIASYIVDWRLSSGGSATSSAPISHSTGTSSYKTVIKFLIPGEKYAVFVKARNNVGIGKSSIEKLHRTIPNPPASVRADSATSNSVTLQWTTPQSTLSSYNVFFNLDTGTLTKVSQDKLTKISTTSYKVTGLEPNSVYKFKLSSVSGTGDNATESKISNSATAVTYPEAPTNVKVKLSDDKTTKAEVSFIPPIKGATEYQASFNAIGETPARNSSGASPIYVNRLTPGQTYNVSVTAFGDAGYGKPAETKYITMAPLPVQGLVVDAFTNSYISVSWNSPIGQTLHVFDKQMLNYHEKHDSSLPSNISLSKTATSYNLTGLTSGGDYTIEVVTISKNISSDITSVHQATGIMAPINLVILNQTAESLEVNWKAPPAPVFFDKYVVEYSLPDELEMPTNTKYKNVTRNTNVANLTGLIPGTMYFVSVKCIGKTYGKSASQRFPTSPETVKNLTVVQNSDDPTTRIDLSWISPRGAGENITVSYIGFSDNTNGTKVLSFTSNSTYFTLAPGNLYDFNVTVNSFHLSSMVANAEMNTKPFQPLYKVTPSTNSLKLSWNEPKGYFEKVVIESIPENVFQNVNLSATKTSYTIQDLRPYTDYTIVLYSLSLNALGGYEKSEFTPSIYRTSAAPAEFPNLTSSLNAAAHSTSNLITFVLPENTFNDKNGPIEYYAVYITTVAYTASYTSSTQPDLTRNDTCEQFNAGGLGECVTLWTDGKGRPNDGIEQRNSSRNRRSYNHPVGNPRITFIIGTGNTTRSPWGQSFKNFKLHASTAYVVSVAAKTGSIILTATNWSQAIETGLNVPLIIGIVIAIVAFIILVAILIVFLKRRSKQINLEQVMMSTVVVNDSAMTTERRETTSKVINLSDFDNLMETMRADSDLKFSDEYEQFKSVGCEQSKSAAMLPENHGKNRYTNIVPYDATRVKLGATDDEPGTDYINASFIPGYSSQREYIATQGPLPSTKDDFWRMIWEQNSRNIVMITQTVERGRIKCEHYWPFDNEPISFGDMTLQMTSESILLEWTVREFKLTHRNLLKKIFRGGDARRIRQFQYTVWPDHGVPDTAENFVQFVRYVRKTIDREAKHTGPTTVHCSAGVGRTGTFIAMDRLLQQIKEHSYVDVFGIVYQMRKHRSFMVQTESQYILIHQTIQDIYNGNINADNYDRRQSLPGEEHDVESDKTKM